MANIKAAVQRRKGKHYLEKCRKHFREHLAKSKTTPEQKRS
jgi:hypothetical protein